MILKKIRLSNSLTSISQTQQLAALQQASVQAQSSQLRIPMIDSSGGTTLSSQHHGGKFAFPLQNSTITSNVNNKNEVEKTAGSHCNLHNRFKSKY